MKEEHQNDQCNNNKRRCAGFPRIISYGGRDMRVTAPRGPLPEEQSEAQIKAKGFLSFCVLHAPIPRTTDALCPGER